MKNCMLAETCDDVTKLKYPQYGSPKLDGIRARIEDGVVVSRTHIPIPNDHVQALFGNTRLNGLDGELIVGDAHGEGVFNRTVRGTRKKDAVADVTFNVFDDYTAEGPFRERYLTARERINHECVAGVLFVRHRLLASAAELLDYEDRAVVGGYEGIMTRDPAGPYKSGRSTLLEGWLLKIKRFKDSECEILDALPAMTNNNEATTDANGYAKRSSAKANKAEKDTLGRLLVRDIHDGREFKIGTGWDAKEASALWSLYKSGALKGQIGKFRYQTVGQLNKPRFPSWQGRRPGWDIGEPL